ncbi:MAG: LysM peptidoglycan-binding domain-containing protein [Chloroflexota bacterium]
MVQRKRAEFFWRAVIVALILVVVGALAFVMAQFTGGAWTLFATPTPTATFTPTPVIPTSTLYVPSDTPTATATPLRIEPITYTVVSGDSLTLIGATYGVDVETLIHYNNLASPDLFVGQQLNIPPSDYKFEPPTATAIPTDLRPGTVISYTITAGDLLGLIAEKFNSRVDDIVNLNRDVLPDPNNIPVGVTIKIPYNSILITPSPTPRPTRTRTP